MICKEPVKGLVQPNLFIKKIRFMLFKKKSKRSNFRLYKMSIKLNILICLYNDMYIIINININNKLDRHVCLFRLIGLLRLMNLLA